MSPGQRCSAATAGSDSQQGLQSAPATRLGRVSRAAARCCSAALSPRLPAGPALAARLRAAPRAAARLRPQSGHATAPAAPRHCGTYATGCSAPHVHRLQVIRLTHQLVEHQILGPGVSGFVKRLDRTRLDRARGYGGLDGLGCLGLRPQFLWRTVVNVRVRPAAAS